MTRSGLVGRYLTVLDLKTSCWALSASVRWTKTICRGSRVPQPMKIAMRVISNMAEIYSAPSLNTVSRDKKSVSVRQTDVPTNFNPIWPRQRICSSTTKSWASVRQPLIFGFGKRWRFFGFFLSDAFYGFWFYQGSDTLHCRTQFRRRASALPSKIQEISSSKRPCTGVLLNCGLQIADRGTCGTPGICGT